MSLVFCFISLQFFVFTDSQIIIDKVTEIVSHSYYLRSLEEESFERQLWSGFLNLGSLVEICFLNSFRPILCLNCLLLMIYLVYFSTFFIVAQLNYNEFVMPAVLPEISTKDIKSLEPNLGSLTPALIYFPDRCAPGGAFCCLSVHLISECGWRITDTFYRLI